MTGVFLLYPSRSIVIYTRMGSVAMPCDPPVPSLFLKLEHLLHTSTDLSIRTNSCSAREQDANQLI